MAFDGLEIIKPSELYNLLQQKTVYPCVSDPNYLLLIDARNKRDYGESHVMTAKIAPRRKDGQFTMVYDAEVECKDHAVVYDENTTTLSRQEAPAVQYARLLWSAGSRHPVKVLRGGYEDFSARYPFLRTQKVIYMPRELDVLKTYPLEILKECLYLGDWEHGNTAYIQKDLKIKAYINLCMEERKPVVKDDPSEVLHIPVQDDNDGDLLSHFNRTCSFIDIHKKEKKSVLVFSTQGISRAVTVVVAYLMKHNKCPLEMAYHQVKRCQFSLRPNRGFIEQLSAWEKKLFGSTSTNINDPNY